MTEKDWFEYIIIVKSKDCLIGKNIIYHMRQFMPVGISIKLKKEVKP